MVDVILAAFLGFALGMLVQEIHFRRITRELDEIVERAGLNDEKKG